ncbi:hypothetical protein WOC09_02265 [Vibrio parahaemolyticus]|uniref:hypothetical protein n=1 Tax=Vibrio parahaemolyticus TaxID=670 RepID=UPI000407D438|nr:hypothetical protein [Vibrio parahaemolyticus]EHV9705091.1 hypothetical protein [Vibrio parahaemolyticus]EIZ1547606.1 hypothetical protein [Vibrio parahaemolyticus]
MTEYKWQGWGLLPLFISKKAFSQIISSAGWSHWAKGLSTSEIKDVRRFYTRSSADLLRPLKSGRFTLTNGEEPLFTLANSSLLDCGHQVNITKLQLLELGEIYLLYIHYESPLTFSADSISKLNRSVFQWEPKTEKHKVSQWMRSGQETKGLKQHISELLDISLDQDTHYGEDTFGHELVNCTWVKQVTSFESKETICVSELSAGINVNDPRYKLSASEKQRLIETQFDYWADWRCQFNLNRLVFVDQTPEESSLTWNLSNNNYYLDLFAAVVCQRTALKRFKDEMILCSHKRRGALYERISKFRRQYKIAHISTYPFAEKLYGYFCNQARLSEIEESTFVELEHNHSLWKQEREESSNTVLLLVSLVAALLVPASSIATIMALTDEQMNSVFWSLSGVITVLTVLVMIWPPLKRYLKVKALD